MPAPRSERPPDRSCRARRGRAARPRARAAREIGSVLSRRWPPGGFGSSPARRLDVSCGWPESTTDRRSARIGPCQIRPFDVLAPRIRPRTGTLWRMVDPGRTAPRVTRQETLIAGRWMPATDGRYAAVRSPATGETIAEVPIAVVGDVDRAVQAARTAQRELAALGVFERAALLDRVAALIEERKHAIARDLAQEQGKP